MFPVVIVVTAPSKVIASRPNTAKSLHLPSIFSTGINVVEAEELTPEVLDGEVEAEADEELDGDSFITNSCEADGDLVAAKVDECVAEVEEGAEAELEGTCVPDREVEIVTELVGLGN